MWRTLLTSVSVLIALAAPLPPGVLARTSERCFPETGYCVGGALLTYWERNGGLQQFGYPITSAIPNETVENTWVGTTQWFERVRLEDHGAAGVLAGRLGAQLLAVQGRSWWEFPRPGPTPNCTFFAETNHNLCEPFLSYWQSNGGLARFGYPLSDPMDEQTSEWRGTVQFFERVRMEWHPELRGTRYEVLLGRIGAEVHALAPPVLCITNVAPLLQDGVAALPFREWLGCPTTLYNDTPAAVQHMEHGVMLWFDFGSEGKIIYYTYPTPEPGSPLVYGQTLDTWQAGVDPEDYGISAPPGLYPPRRGFGKVYWQTFRRGPNWIGLGTEPEHAERATVQRFSSGAIVIRLERTGEFFGFGRTYRDVYQLKLPQ